MNTRNLVYTAVTRAQKQVFLVGESKALRIALKQTRNKDRKTSLQDRIHQRMETTVQHNMLAENHLSLEARP